jgi:hypothetical protein
VIIGVSLSSISEDCFKINPLFSIEPDPHCYTIEVTLMFISFLKWIFLSAVKI